jgi:hypothetical protein
MPDRENLELYVGMGLAVALTLGALAALSLNVMS